jgi:transporter family-2 protein
VLASLVLDGFGWLGVPREPLGPPQIAGALAVLAGAALIVGASTRRSAPARVPWLAFAMLAGAALPLQGAVNAQLRADLDAPIAVGALSFVVATAGMGLLLAGSLSIAGSSRPRLGPLRGMPWWGWLGGLVGATYVTAVFTLIPEIGAAPTIALTVGGQQIASVLVDRFGLLRLPRRPIARQRLVGVGALLTGVALVQLA